MSPIFRYEKCWVYKRIARIIPLYRSLEIASILSTEISSIISTEIIKFADCPVFIYYNLLHCECVVVWRVWTNMSPRNITFYPLFPYTLDYSFSFKKINICFDPFVMCSFVLSPCGYSYPAFNPLYRRLQSIDKWQVRAEYLYLSAHFACWLRVVSPAKGAFNSLKFCRSGCSIMFVVFDSFVLIDKFCWFVFSFWMVIRSPIPFHLWLRSDC